ncbi:4-oxalomesaconate tautomerase [Pseudomonas viridiflava]|uniref:4-oxalomesaconate tautomerase n=1 Tax=Pseudomonas viridiflava TaxID=33069 RepID=UPI000F05F2B2|nr:4-oxalomesaconate tautomerase [Pseudomonas viridiflava]
MAQNRIPCLMMRGGTSKGAYFLADDLPSDAVRRDALLLAAMGSPDPRQIDGIGGADSLTSKVAIIRRSSRPGVDVDYLFAQVVVNEPRVDYGQNCGNILAGVGPFALERGLLPIVDGQTPVRIYMENTGQTATALVQTANGQVRYDGEARIDGVPGTAAAVVVRFDDIAGSSCGALLPTGNARDRFNGIEVTCIDNGMPVVLLRAADLGLNGQESPAELNANEALKAQLESIRLQAGTLMKLGDVSARTVPKMSIVSSPTKGGSISSRTFIPHTCHAAIGVFGAVSVASACLVPGAVTEGLANVPPGDNLALSVEHPTGEFTVEIRRDKGEIAGCGLLRTARLLFDGHVLIPELAVARS